jgi:hypothetical protein
MNNSTSYINHVNTRAVQLMQKSRHKEAISCLQRALTFVLNRVADTNSDPPSLVPFAFEVQQQSMQDHRSSLKCMDSMDIIEGEERLTYTVAIPEGHDTMSISPGNVFVIFNRAFTHYKHGVFSSSANCTKGTAILLYNMGLAFHHLGIQKNNTAVLKKSLYTYQMAYRVLLSQNCDDSFSCLVMLALCNNMSHIHGHFFNLKEARGLWDLLTGVLDCVSLEGSSDAVLDDYAFFATEKMLFEERQLEKGFAPAA